MRASGQFAMFLQALDASDTDAAIAGAGPFTVFAPTDAAYAKLSATARERYFANTQKLTKTLLSHVVAGAHSSADLAQAHTEKRRLTTLSGMTLLVKARSGTIKVGTGDVTTPALAATNGVIYAVDDVLDR